MYFIDTNVLSEIRKIKKRESKPRSYSLAI